MKRLINVEANVLAAFTVALLVVFAIATLTWKVAGDATDATRLVVHSQDTINKLAQIKTDTVQIELSTQGFRISGDPAQLAMRDATIASREALLKDVQRQTSGNPRQQELWSRLRQVIDERLLISRRVEALRKTQGPEAANAYAATAPLQATRARTKQILDDMDAEVLRSLAESNAQQLVARERIVGLGLFASILLLSLLAVTYWFIRHQLREVRTSQRALAESEDGLSTILRSIGDAVMATDTQGRITHMNPVAERLTGWPLTEARGQSVDAVFCIVHEQTGRPAEIPIAKVLAGGEVEELANHTVLISRHGTRFPIADSAAPVRGAEGNLRGVVLVFRDETTAREAEKTIHNQNVMLEHRVQESTEQLRQSESHLRSVINSVPALIAYVDNRQKYVYVNRQYQERFAPEKLDITGCSVREILGEDRYRIAEPVIEKVLAGDPQSYDWQPFPGIWQVISYLPSKDEHGKVSGYYVLGTDITERRHIEEALQDREQQLQRVLRGSSQGYWDWNLESNRFQVSAQWEAMLGYEPGEMRVDTDNWPALVHPDDLPLAMASIKRHLDGLAENHEVELRVKTKQGGWCWILTRGKVVAFAEDGKPLMMSGTHTDISDRKQFEQDQREAAIVFDSSYEGILVANADGLITKVNPAFTRVTGYTQSEVIGCSPRMLSSGRHDARFFVQFWQELNQKDFWHGEIWNRRKNGEMYAALQSVSVARDVKGDIQHYVSVFADISQLKAHEAELDHVANYDSLTELPNRRLLSDRLTQSILRADRSGKSTAVCFLDLDGFKAINDRLGHAVGDQVLVDVSQHLKSVLRADDTLARLGGDEFIVLLSEVASPEECAQILGRLQDAVRRPLEVAGQVIRVSASVGVSLYPADNADPDTLLRHADQAMYLAKQAGKDRYQMFDPEIDRITQTHREFLVQMERALSREEFILFYQPKVDLMTGDMIGVEALIRWQHPARGLLSPAEFLPHLNGSSLEGRFGEWVIDTALTQIQAWREQGLPTRVSVNVSANHLLQADFEGRLGQTLRRHHAIAPSDLELEVLETAAIDDMQQAVDILQRCMKLGVKFSLDDFGTGYSSLTYLRKLPVDTLKIDQSFVRDMLTDPVDLGIVKGVIQLASVFHRQVIAEGVETLQHGAALRQLGCHLVQGYGISRPMPASQLPAWCIEWQQAGVWRTL